MTTGTSLFCVVDQHFSFPDSFLHIILSIHLNRKNAEISLYLPNAWRLGGKNLTSFFFLNRPIVTSLGFTPDAFSYTVPFFSLCNTYSQNQYFNFFSS